MMSVSFPAVGCMLSTSSTSPCLVAFSATAGFMMSVSFVLLVLCYLSPLHDHVQ